MINKQKKAAGEIVQLWGELVTSRAKTFGPEHQDAMSCMSDLALTIHSIGNHHAEAVELYRQVLASQERCLAPSHGDTFCTITNLAIAVPSIGNRNEAVELHRRALEARKKTLGPEHPVTFAVRQQFGSRSGWQR